jgi:hypothetical protein
MTDDAPINPMDDQPITRKDVRKWTNHWVAKAGLICGLLGAMATGIVGWAKNYAATMNNTYRLGLVEGAMISIPDRVVALESKQVDDRKRIMDNTIIIQDGKAERIKMYAQFAQADVTQAKILEHQDTLFQKNQEAQDMIFKNQEHNRELLIARIDSGDKVLLSKFNELRNEVAELRGTIKGAMDKLKGLALVPVGCAGGSKENTSN